MSENPTGDERTEPDEEQAEHAPQGSAGSAPDGEAADVGAIPGEQPRDDPDEEGEDRFDAG
ncbi:hypothetical protein LEP48_11625 [Isoptericola sp. NEAU-Y5]|uniref:Uncharacterized protein n=1 Tax=Isoptericola luteus TaxID=2879484 RepID=A0ABS7ZI64_9MICO|nr:hypothetical protein [Isoptericola sp. NEAU-Y5]MCA5893991.1 hypothetical protein [Isoptericola sp. NEAU-Y5]